MLYFLMLYFVILIYPIVGYFDGESTINYYTSQIEKSKNSIKKDKRYYTKIESNNKQLVKINKDLEELSSLRKKRTDWLSLLKHIEENIPFGILLTTIKIAGKEDVLSKNNESLVDSVFKDNIKWQQDNKKPLKANEVDKILIKGYSIYDVSIDSVEESLPERFLKKLKEFDLEFIMLAPSFSGVKNEIILDEAQNITSFQMIITLFNPLLALD